MIVRGGGTLIATGGVGTNGRSANGGNPAGGGGGSGAGIGTNGAWGGTAGDPLRQNGENGGAFVGRIVVLDGSIVDGRGGDMSTKAVGAGGVSFESGGLWVVGSGGGGKGGVGAGIGSGGGGGGAGAPRDDSVTGMSGSQSNGQPGEPNNGGNGGKGGNSGITPPTNVAVQGNPGGTGGVRATSSNVFAMNTTKVFGAASVATVKAITYYQNDKDSQGNIIVPGVADMPAGSTQVKYAGQNLTIAAAPKSDAHDFIEWNTKADGTGVTYEPGDEYTAEASLLLFAIWEDPCCDGTCIDICICHLPKASNCTECYNCSETIGTHDWDGDCETGCTKCTIGNQTHTAGTAANCTTPQTCTNLTCGATIVAALTHSPGPGTWQHNASEHWRNCSRTIAVDGFDCSVEIPDSRGSHGWGAGWTDGGADCERECTTCSRQETQTGHPNRKMANCTACNDCPATGLTRTTACSSGTLCTFHTPPTGKIEINSTNYWQDFITTITFGAVRFNNQQTVTVTATNNSGTTGTVTRQYYLADSEVTITTLQGYTTEWQTYSTPFNIDPSRRYVVYVKLTDPAGNVTYISSDGTIVCGNTDCASTERDNHGLADCNITGHWQCSSGFDASKHNTYTITDSVTNATISNLTPDPRRCVSWSGTLTADTGYSRPASITMTMGGSNFTNFSYTSSTGVITINADVVTGNIVISGTAELTPYTVTWNVDGGSPTPTQTSISSGATINAPTTMTKTGYTFGGWFTNASKTTEAIFPITNVTSNMEFWAKWDVCTHAWGTDCTAVPCTLCGATNSTHDESGANATCTTDKVCARTGCTHIITAATCENLPHVCTTCSRTTTCGAHACATCNIACPNLPHVCITCSRTTTCGAHICTTCEITCSNLPHVCTECSRTTTCGTHACTTCGIACPNLPHVCTECIRTTTCGAHTCTTCGITCSNLPHVCTECSRTTTCGTHACVTCSIACPSLPHACTTCDRTITCGACSCTTCVNTCGGHGCLFTGCTYNCGECECCLNDCGGHSCIYPECEYNCGECNCSICGNNCEEIHGCKYLSCAWTCGAHVCEPCGITCTLHVCSTCNRICNLNPCVPCGRAGGGGATAPSPSPSPSPIVVVEVKTGNTVPDAAINTNIQTIINIAFTPEEIVRINNGESARVFVVVEDISETVSTEERTIINNTMTTISQTQGNMTLGLFLDITKFKQVGSSDAVQLKELGQKISISILIPEELRAEGREFQIIRIHDGEVEIITGTYDHGTGLFTFETDRFSTYALVYADRRAPKTGEPWSPHPGIYWQLVIGFTILFLGVGGEVNKKFKRKYK